MVDYSIITNHTDYGMQLMQQDPLMASKLASEADVQVRNATNGSYGISKVSINYAAKDTWYDLEPLTASAKAKIQQASLGTPSVGWFNTIKKIIAIIVAVAAVIIGALVGGWALLAGAIIGVGVLLYSYLTDRIEYKQDMTEVDDEYARQLKDGEITQEQYELFTASKHKIMEGEGISWKLIIIAGMVGFGILAAFYILTKR